MRRNRTTGIAAALLAATLLAACGSDDEASSPEPTEEAAAGDAAEAAEVTIERSRFEPDEVTIAAGGSVTWENLDAFDHTVTSKEGSPVAFDSGTLEEGATFEQTFAEPGTYEYFCEVHPTMRSTVVVE